MLIHEKKVLKHIADRLKKSLPARLLSVYAFGSRVRGDFDEWSDFDMLIIVKNRNTKIESQIIGIIVDEEMKSGLSFAPVIKDIRAFEMEKKYKTPFYENIKKEGMRL